MLEESLPDMLRPLLKRKQSVGRCSPQDPQEDLVDALGGVFKFHERVVPWTGGCLLNQNFSPHIATLSSVGAKGLHPAVGKPGSVSVLELARVMLHGVSD